MLFAESICRYGRSCVQDITAKIAKPLYEVLQVKSSMPQFLPCRCKSKGLQLSFTACESPKHAGKASKCADQSTSPCISNLWCIGVPHTNASEEGFGAIIFQQQGGKLRLNGNGSRTLRSAEQNYRLCSGNLEYLALKWAVCEKFRDSLLISTAKLNAVGHRWVGELSDICFNIKYRPLTLTLSRFQLGIFKYMALWTENCF